MSIKVLDFYTDGKVKAGVFSGILGHDALFCIMVELNGEVKELATIVKANNSFTSVVPSNFNPKKFNEYCILRNFLEESKERIKDKWNLTEREYNDLLIELELCLIEKYSNGDFIKGLVLRCKGIVKRFINTLTWRLVA